MSDGVLFCRREQGKISALVMCSVTRVAVMKGSGNIFKSFEGIIGISLCRSDDFKRILTREAFLLVRNTSRTHQYRERNHFIELLTIQIRYLHLLH